MVPAFRPEDRANHGTGVLIEYACYRQAAEAAPAAEPAVDPVRPGYVPLVEVDVADVVRTSILEVLGEARAEAYGPQVPLMEMGFSSFHLQELRSSLGERVGLKLEATFFFQHGTPAAIIDHLREQLAPVGVEQDDVLQQADAEASRPSAAADDIDSSERIAVIGVACRFPGGVGNPEQFWTLLENGVDAIGERGPGVSPAAGSTRRGGFIDEVDCFDAGFFRISPREAELVDPQHRLLLEVVWEALEQAGIAPGRLAGSDTGVFVGVMGHDYERLLRQQGSAQPIDPYFATGNANSIAAGRIAYYYDWHGPTLAVDTACSSSLVATHLACESLLGGECGLALAGGVNLLLHEDMFAAFEQAGMLSPEARCKTFDASADGYVRGEGCAVLVLKRLSEARRDGDPVWAVIRGSAINQDGASAGLTAPNQKAQQAVIEAALRKGGVAPHALRYLEAHGTGTRLGDPIEVLAASAALGAGRSAEELLLLGSVKTNIGHLEAASGVAGLIKVMLSMRHGLIPRHLHLRQLNPYLDWAGLPVEVVGEARAWPAGSKLAGVSSFGFSGTNAHVVLEEYTAEPANATQSSALLLLSAKRPELLQTQARQLHEALGALGEADLPDIAYTLQVGRDAMEYRLALAGGSLAELRQALARFLAGEAGIRQLWQGRSSGQQGELLGSFVLDEAFNASIATSLAGWFARGELGKLAELWVQGLDVDWCRLYGANPPRRIGLPTYPFVKERHWLPQAAVQAVADLGGPPPLHPLVHRNTSDLAQQRYSSRLDKHAFYLRDHVVQGRHVLPGVAQLEWARAAMALALGETPAALRLEQVSWVQALTVDQALEVHIGIDAEEGGRLAYEIHRGLGDDVEVYSLGWGRLGASSEVPVLDLSALRSQCTRQMDGPACYARFARMGLAYGPAFQVLTELRVGEEVVIGRLQAPAGIELGDFCWSPSLLDGALQASYGLVDETAAGLQLPFAVESVEQWHTLPESALVVVQRAAGDSGALRKLDISIVDESGRAALRLAGFSTRAVQAAAAPADSLLMAPHWQAQPVAEERPELGYRTHRVVLCEVEAEVEALAGGLDAALPTASSVHWRVPGSLDARYAYYAGQLLGELQALAAGQPADPVLLQLVVPAQGEAAVLQGLAGLLCTAQQEYPGCTAR